MNGRRSRYMWDAESPLGVLEPALLLFWPSEPSSAMPLPMGRCVSEVLSPLTAFPQETELPDCCAPAPHSMSDSARSP